MKDRSSLSFSLWKTTKLVLIPFAVLDIVIFVISTMQHGFSVAWTDIKQLAVPELGVWLVITFAMLLERRINTRFTAVQEELEELKERISHLETRGDH